MTEFRDGTYVGERALFATKDANFTNCVFRDGGPPNFYRQEFSSFRSIHRE